MALIDCRECGRQISDQATACVNCGAPIVRQTAGSMSRSSPTAAAKRKGGVSVGLIAGIAFGVVGLLALGLIGVNALRESRRTTVLVESDIPASRQGPGVIANRTGEKVEKIASFDSVAQYERLIRLAVDSNRSSPEYIDAMLNAVLDGAVPEGTPVNIIRCGSIAYKRTSTAYCEVEPKSGPKAGRRIVVPEKFVHDAGK